MYYEHTQAEHARYTHHGFLREQKRNSESEQSAVDVLGVSNILMY
jgi:hypothetical protein